MPFIIVTGSMNEDTAVDCMKAGAWDYVIKEHVKRLGSAIEGALERQRLWKKRKQAERALEASEVRHRRLFEAAKDGILIVDADSGKIVDVNPFLIELTGYSHQEFLGEHIWEIGPFKDTAASREAFHNLRSEHYIRYEELPLETREGRNIDVEFVSNVYRVDGKDVIQCNIRDITARKHAERRDQERRATLKAVLESTDFPIFAVDRAFCYTGFNRAHANVMKALYGVDIQLGARLAECQTVAQDWEITKKNLERALQGETVWESALSGDEVKSRRYFEVTHNPVRTDTGDIVGVSVFARDVTQRKRMELEREQLEQQLRVSQKMEAIGSLASGVAHDFNNLLSVILSYTGMALDDSREGGDLRDGLLEVKQAANRAAALTRQLSAFSRKQVLRPATLNLNDIATGVEKMLQRVLREDIVKQSNGNIWVDSEPGQGASFKICLPRDFTATATRTRPPVSIRRRRGHETMPCGGT